MQVPMTKDVFFIAEEDAFVNARFFFFKGLRIVFPCSIREEDDGRRVIMELD